MSDVKMFRSLFAEFVELYNQRRSVAVLMESPYEEGQRDKQGLCQRKRFGREFTTYIHNKCLDQMPVKNSEEGWNMISFTNFEDESCRKHRALRPQEPFRLVREGEVGGREFLYLTPTRYTDTTRMILY